MSDEVNKVQYFKFIVNSTQDVSHVDLTFVLSYLKPDRQVVELLFGFIPIKSYEAVYLKSIVLQKYPI